MRVLITGITGFVGVHLASHLLADRPGTEVFGLRRWRSSTASLEHLLPSIHVLEGDLLDAPSLLRALSAARPDAVFHLAASSSVAGSWDTPAEMMQVNAMGALNLLEAVRQCDLDVPVVLACSAEEYGQVSEGELPIGEEQPLRPISPYGVSKAALDLLGYQYFRSFGLRTMRLRVFNLCGPGQPERFVLSGFARQIAEIEAGLRPPELKVGNLDARRDFVDVRDGVRAMASAPGRCEAGQAYNVGSGRSHRIRELLDRMLALSDAVIDVRLDAARLRPSDIPVLQADTSRFHAATGWAPAIPCEQTLCETLDYWRARVGRA